MLADVFHQPHAQQLIQRAITAERVPHAYLFHGPDGVGTELLAHGLAQRLLCAAPVERPLDAATAAAIGLPALHDACGTCEDCRFVAAGTHPDLHLVYRQLSREHPDAEVRKRKALEIGIDVLRTFVIEEAGRTSRRGRRKLFIIREADRITGPAQNALLKTLEEPPGETVIVLLAQSADRLMPTTLSRCQAVRFDALPTEFVRERLANACAELPPEQLDWYARCANGSIGAALRHAEDDLFGLNQRLTPGFADFTAPGRRRPEVIEKAWTEEAKALGERYRKRAPEITDTESQRQAYGTIMRLAATWFADALHVRAGNAAGVVNTSASKALARAAGEVTFERSAESIQRLTLAEYQLDVNANTQLCIETLVSELAAIDH